MNTTSTEPLSLSWRSPTIPDTTGLETKNADRVPPGDRGTLKIDAKVVERIAARTADRVDHAGGSTNRLLSLPGSRATKPKVTADIDGRLARLSLTMAVDYPAPIGAVTRTARARIISTVKQLTGIDVKEVNITISALSHNPTQARVQ